MVPDVNASCERFANLGVEFVKKPNDGIQLFSLERKFGRSNHSSCVILCNRENEGDRIHQGS